MKILYCSSEVVPFAKTGGLADVAGALPKALKEVGHDVRIVMPCYKMIGKDKFDLRLVSEDIEVDLGDKLYKADIYSSEIPDSEVIIYLIDHKELFGVPDGLYQVKGKDIANNFERFAFFCKVIPLFLKFIGWQPDVVHGNDWQAGLLLAYLKIIYKDDPFFLKIATVYSIHNMAYQGLFSADKFNLLGLGEDQFKPETMEFWGKISLSKAGILYADVINTVSEQYAKEIQTEEFGCGLDGLMRTRSKDIYGIVNGVDYDIWNPATDRIIAKRYSPHTLSLKQENKKALLKKQGLEINLQKPLLGIISRLCDQKGFDILSSAMENIMSLDTQFVLLGTGEPKYHKMFENLKKKYPKVMGINLGFDAALAQDIYAGVDMFLMPSHYEPCGLGQIISFKYGTIPIVRKTGGLADTVIDFTSNQKNGNGFVFEKVDPQALFDAVKRAVDVFRKKPLDWEQLQKKVMRYDYSWKTSAIKYIDLYKKAIEKKDL